MADKQSFTPSQIELGSPWPYRVGIGITAVWLGGIAFYVYAHIDKILTLEPNAIGDMIAGAAAPLAFLWLVLGYYQQKVELRLNTAALHLQARELAQQTAALEAQQRETAELVRASQSQVEVMRLQHDESKRMRLEPESHEYNLAGETRLFLRNRGATGHQVRVSSVGKEGKFIYWSPRAALQRDGLIEIKFEAEHGETDRLCIEYADQDGRARHVLVDVLSGNASVVQGEKSA